MQNLNNRFNTEFVVLQGVRAQFKMYSWSYGYFIGSSGSLASLNSNAFVKLAES